MEFCFVFLILVKSHRAQVKQADQIQKNTLSVLIDLFM